MPLGGIGRPALEQVLAGPPVVLDERVQVAQIIPIMERKPNEPPIGPVCIALHRVGEGWIFHMSPGEVLLRREAGINRYVVWLPGSSGPFHPEVDAMAILFTTSTKVETLELGFVTRRP
jgi:hypothetical protein